MEDPIVYHSQIGQDKYVIEEVFKQIKDGVFIDVGAHNGVAFSNTLTLERYFDWSGICIEPLPNVFEQLQQNRKCVCENIAISSTNKIDNFLQVSGYAEMLSGLIKNYHPNHVKRIDNEVKGMGGSKNVIQVKCATLSSLFEKHNIHHVHYLSIDVEGSEEEVLNSIDFSKTFIDVIDLENNYNNTKIVDFLATKGFFVLKKIDFDILFININSKFVSNEISTLLLYNAD
jgi:FkbM family methyltransferase